MRPYVIIDVDTTLANNEHRAVLLTKVCSDCEIPLEEIPCICGSEKHHTPQAAWDQFLHPELLVKDSPQPHALDVIEKMRSRFWNIVFMTGRSERLRDVTELWLQEHMGLRDDEPVIMRPNVHRNVAASVMKEKMFLDYCEVRGIQNENFLFFEDDKYVLGTWEKYGLVFQCPEAWQFMNPVVLERNDEPKWNR